jgi:hypothetical protein
VIKRSIRIAESTWSNGRQNVPVLDLQPANFHWRKENFVSGFHAFAHSGKFLLSLPWDFVHAIVPPPVYVRMNIFTTPES